MAEERKMVKVKYKFAISLRNNHTGEEIVLGMKHDSREKAEEYAEKNVCERCNSFSIFPVPRDSHWVNKIGGFQKNECKNKTRRSRC